MDEVIKLKKLFGGSSSRNYTLSLSTDQIVIAPGGSKRIVGEGKDDSGTEAGGSVQSTEGSSTFSSDGFSSCHENDVDDDGEEEMGSSSSESSQSDDSEMYGFGLDPDDVLDAKFQEEDRKKLLELTQRRNKRNEQIAHNKPPKPCTYPKLPAILSGPRVRSSSLGTTQVPQLNFSLLPSSSSSPHCTASPQKPNSSLPRQSSQRSSIGKTNRKKKKKQKFDNNNGHLQLITNNNNNNNNNIDNGKKEKTGAAASKQLRRSISDSKLRNDTDAHTFTIQQKRKPKKKRKHSLPRLHHLSKGGDLSPTSSLVAIPKNRTKGDFVESLQSLATSPREKQHPYFAPMEQKKCISRSDDNNRNGMGDILNESDSDDNHGDDNETTPVPEEAALTWKPIWISPTSPRQHSNRSRSSSDVATTYHPSTITTTTATRCHNCIKKAETILKLQNELERVNSQYLKLQEKYNILLIKK